MSAYPQQQGGMPYPPQGGYPAPNQGGYPAPAGQGYPHQGHPPQGQGYPSQGQGQPAGAIPRYAGEMPDVDRHDDPNLQAPTRATAPPPEMPQSFPGYGYMGFDEAPAPPPTVQNLPTEAPTREACPEFVSLTFEEAKGAVTEFAAEQCCYGKGPAEKLEVTDIQASSAFHYHLESFCENRSTKWESEPYGGGAVVVTGPPPGPWDICVNVPDMFKDSKLKMEVPNTSVVKPCHTCFGRGFERCFRCHGRGQLQCNYCNGTGTATVEGETCTCTTCNGSGRKSCYTCDGFGQTRCFMCEGFAQVRWFIQLTVKWRNHEDDHVVERSSMPDELIKDVAGKTVLQETSLRVFPINNFQDQEINIASNELVNQHANKYISERTLQQRHNLRIVPVNSVSYSLENTIGNYFVYGLERKVYFPDYPAKCCWGCNIL